MLLLPPHFFLSVLSVSSFLLAYSHSLSIYFPLCHSLHCCILYEKFYTLWRRQRAAAVTAEKHRWALAHTHIMCVRFSSASFTRQPMGWCTLYFILPVMCSVCKLKSCSSRDIEKEPCSRNSQVATMSTSSLKYTHEATYSKAERKKICFFFIQKRTKENKDGAAEYLVEWEMVCEFSLSLHLFLFWLLFFSQQCVVVVVF